IDGAWANNNDPYVSIHRLAINGDYRGMGLSNILFSNLITIAYASGIRNLRVDTHEANIVVQSLVKNFGFEYRGIVNIDGTPSGKRLAYELNLGEKQ
ncbi:MAG: GNAT family N-acetyltransferase, partial [Micrococcaceae bacterium]